MLTHKILVILYLKLNIKQVKGGGLCLLTLKKKRKKRHHWMQYLMMFWNMSGQSLRAIQGQCPGYMLLQSKENPPQLNSSCSIRDNHISCRNVHWCWYSHHYCTAIPRDHIVRETGVVGTAQKHPKQLIKWRLFRAKRMNLTEQNLDMYTIEQSVIKSCFHLKTLWTKKKKKVQQRYMVLVYFVPQCNQLWISDMNQFK